MIALRDLPKGSILPPYMGQLLTYREVGLREFNEGMEYTWCPLKNGFAMLKMSQEELMLGPQADEMAFCVDSKEFTDRNENPGRYVNGAKTKEQCELVNVKMCELGRVMCLGLLELVEVMNLEVEKHQICRAGVESVESHDEKMAATSNMI